MPGCPSGVVQRPARVERRAPSSRWRRRGAARPRRRGRRRAARLGGSSRAADVTNALPPPCTNGLDGVVADEGDAPGAVGAGATGSGRPSLRSTTVERAAGLAEERGDPSTSGHAVAPLASNGAARRGARSSAPTRSARRRMRATLSSMQRLGDAPVAHGGEQAVAPRPAGSGHHAGRGRRAAGSTTVCVASQSLTTTPSKPHSSLRIPVSSGLVRRSRRVVAVVDAPL